MRIVNSSSATNGSGMTPDTLLAHAPMLGARSVLSQAINPDSEGPPPTLIEMPAYRIPHSLRQGGVDVGVWWDHEEPVGLETTTAVTSDLVVIAHESVELPHRQLVPADLDNLTLVGFGGLGNRMLAEFCRLMAAADALVHFGDPRVSSQVLDQGGYMLAPATPAASSQLGADVTILPLAHPISARLIVATSPSETNDPSGRTQRPILAARPNAAQTRVA